MLKSWVHLENIIEYFYTFSYYKTQKNSQEKIKKIFKSISNQHLIEDGKLGYILVF